MTNGKKQLIVVGGGGFAREVIWLARDCPQEWEVIGCLDDAEGSQGRTMSDVPVLGYVDQWHKFSDASFVVAVGSPRSRRKIVQKMSSTGSPKFGTLVHPSVHKSFYIELGEGSVITAGCVVTTQIRLGRHNIVNINSTLGHDCVFGDYCTVAPIVAVSGNVTLEDGVEVGTGASLRQGIRLGKGSMVGMGAVVTKDVEENGLVVGNPAKLMKILDPFL